MPEVGSVVHVPAHAHLSGLLPTRLGTIADRLFPLLATLLSIAIGVLLLPRLILFGQFNAAVLAWPWQFDYDEGVNLHAAWLLAHGQNIYLSNPPDHFVSAPYTPVLYVLSLPLLWLGGLNLLAPRLLVLVATLAVGGLLVHLTRRTGAGWPAAALPGLLWLAISPVIVWAALYKQDMLALAWGLGGLAVVLRWPDDRRRYWAVALFALAFFTKQSALAAALAACLWLIWRDRRSGLRFAAALVAAIGGIFVLLMAVSDGGFWDHAILYQQYPWLLRFWERLTGRLGGEYWPLLGIGTLAVLVALGRAVMLLRRAANPRALADSPWSLAVLYMGTATAAVMVETGYQGANNNHLLDLFPPLCWLAGGALGYMAAAMASWRRRAAFVGLAALLVAQTAAFGGLENWYDEGYWPSPTRADELGTRSALVRSADGPVYSEDTGLLLFSGQQPIYDDPHTVAMVGDTGRWDQAQLVQDLRDRRFPYIFLRHGSVAWSAQAQTAFDDSYALKFAGTLDVYAPLIYPAHAQYLVGCALGEPAELALAGWSLGPGVADQGAPPGADLHLALYWHVLAAPGDYATFVHVLDAAGQQVAGRDDPHSTLATPTSRWAVDSDVQEPAAVPLPAGMAPGTYHVIAGVYGTSAGHIVPVAVQCTDAGRRVGNAVDLGVFTVR